MLLADLAPHKLLVDADQAALLPDVVREFVRYAAARTGLADGFVQEILQAVDVHEKQYCDLMADPSAGGPAKAVLSALLARGVPLDDPEACEEALDDLRGAPLPWAPERPSVTTAPADVLKSAAQAPVLARFEALVAFYGQGRKLTAAGQPTLADARQLVGLLGTADRIDPEYGGKVSKTRSATQLREFDFTVRWAVAAGALRRQGNKLVATAAWADLADQPLARWLRAVDALSLLGPLHSRYATHLGGFQELAAFVDTTVPELLDELLERPIPFDTLLENLCENADDEFDWSSPYWNDAEFRRETFRHDLDMLLVILQWGGVTNRTGGAGPGQVALGGHAAVRRVGAADGGRPVVARRGVTGLDAIVWSDFL